MYWAFRGFINHSQQVYWPLLTAFRGANISLIGAAATRSPVDGADGEHHLLLFARSRVHSLAASTLSTSDVVVVTQFFNNSLSFISYHIAITLYCPIHKSAPRSLYIKKGAYTPPFNLRITTLKILNYFFEWWWIWSFFRIYRLLGADLWIGQ